MTSMRNRDFREIQVSSSLLVVIFLAVLALGVFIFLLGVSVGKKQGILTAQSQTASQPVEVTSGKMDAEDLTQASGQVEMKQTTPASSTTEKTRTSLKGSEESVSQKTAPPSTKSSTPSGAGLYYVQVAAFLERSPALNLAETYRKQGYNVIVTDPRPADTQSWYRVRLGGFSSKAEADNLLSRLNAAAGKRTDFRVVRN